MNQSDKRILLAGGGSGGPVAPLLAVAAELRRLDPEIKFLLVGTRTGPEEGMAKDAGLEFVAIPAAKFRRYFSLANFTDVFVFFYSLAAARRVLKRFKPGAVFSAGGFVAVPVSWMAWAMGIKVIVHQQDAGIGLANRLIAPLADTVTAAFEPTAKSFHSGSGLKRGDLKPAAEWVGNPVRPEFFRPLNPEAKKFFKLNESLPVLLVVGGATGASQVNSVAEAALPKLVESHQVIHVTGRGKRTAFQHPNYRQYEFLGAEFPEAMKLADIVISRAGLSTISELSVLKKIAIIVPMPGTHQEDNARVLQDASAAVVLSGEEFNPLDLPRIVTSLKFNVGRRKLLSENIGKIMPHDAAARLAGLIYKYVKQA